MTLSVETLAEAMQNAVIRDDEGEFPCLLDLLGFSGENKARTVTRGLAAAVLTAIEQAGYVVVPGWRPIESAPMDEPFLTAIAVSHISGTGWWERHVIYLDDETGDVHAGCEQGWSLRDYSHWMPLPAAPKIQHSEGE